MTLSPADEHAARREAWVFVVALTAGTVLAPAIPEGAAALFAGLGVLWAATSRRRRAFLRVQIARYHVPPLARASDCLVNIGRHGAAFARRPTGAAAVDVGLSAAFFVTILAPIVALELRKHGPSIEGTAAGLAIGLLAWHVLLEAIHYRRRRAEYRGDDGPAQLSLWPLLVLLFAELSAYLIIRIGGAPADDFVRGVLLGVAAMGLADAATLQSTLLAAVLRGRPLR